MSRKLRADFRIRDISGARMLVKSLKVMEVIGKFVYRARPQFTFTRKGAMDYVFIALGAGLIGHSHHRLAGKGYQPALASCVCGLLFAAAFVLYFMPVAGNFVRSSLWISILMLPTFFYWAWANSVAPKDDGHAEIAFACPFCEWEQTYDPWREGELVNCPSCNEIVTITEDPEVHRRNRESQAALEGIAETAEPQEVSDDAVSILPGTTNNNLTFLAPAKDEIVHRSEAGDDGCR